MTAFEVERIGLLPIDKVEVLILMDNMIDYLLESSEQVIRPSHTDQRRVRHRTRSPLLAEHGLSLLITFYRGRTKSTILFDAGYSELGVLHNMRLLGGDPQCIEAIVLTHGHVDHFGGLLRLLDQISGPIPLVVHPDSFLPVRYTETKTDRIYNVRFEREDLLGTDVEVGESTGPYLSRDGLWAVTGQIPRITDFERTPAAAKMERNGLQEPDWIGEGSNSILIEASRKNF